MEPKPLHRDDVPPEVLEEIVAALQAEHPDCKIQFAGDSDDPKVQAKQQEILEQLDEISARSAATGCCVDCGAIMPGYPAQDAPFPDGWRPAKGWRHFTRIQDDEFTGWQCPDCDARDETQGRCFLQ